MPVRCVAFNCHSIIPKKSEITHFLSINKIQIAMFSETWLKESDSFSIPSYDIYRIDRPYGGVCILISSCIPHSNCVKFSFPFGEAIMLSIHDAQFSIKIGSVYCSPAASRAQASNFFKKILSVSGPAVIAGDFNVKHRDWNNVKNTHKGVDFRNLCFSKRYSIHCPDTPTCIPPHGAPSTLDFVISRSVVGITAPTVLNQLSSDHFPIVFFIPFDSPAQENHKIFNYAKANWKKFRSDLDASTEQLKLTLPTLNSPAAIDACIDKLSENIQTAARVSIPVKSPYRFRYPFSDELRLLTRYRNHYRSRFVRTLDPAYKSLLNQTNRLIKARTSALNQKSFEDRIADLTVANGSLFQFTKSLKNKKAQVPPLKKHDDTLAYSNGEKADALAKGFLKAHLTTMGMKSKHEKSVQQSLARIEADNSIFPSNDLISFSEVETVIASLKIRKAPGPDKIANRLIKNLPG